jgi:ribosomal protein S6--L-glutamate ligase|tara:strand:+ start:234 stop:1619 length:1386 start_codon:yes stop_codon:yes gene_type:complete
MVDSFKSFLTEQNGTQPYKILVVSAEPENSKLFHTAQRITDEAKKSGHKVFVVKVEGAIITYDNNVYKISNASDDEEFEINSSDTIAIVRGSVRLKKSYLDLLSQLEKIGVCMVNSRDTVELSSDKYRTYLRLQDYGLTQPKTVLIPNEKTWKDALEKLESKFPIIMKTLEGSKGIGVLFIESERQIESLIQLLYSQNNDVDLLIQEYIKTDGDIRVIVLGGKIIAAMKRDVIEGDFRSNVSQGAKIKEYPLTELEVEQCLLAAKAIDGSWTAVDFIPSKNPKKEPPFILEVNHSPGTEGIEKASGQNIVKLVIDHYSNPDNRHYVPIQCGYFEIINIKPFGDTVAKFDTGNSATASTIHADKIKVDGKKVTWTYNGKTTTSKIQRIAKVDVGGLNNYTEERYAILLDIEFTGSIYKNVEFLLDDRTDRTPVLLNRKTMRMLNVMVNPQRKYIITTKYVLD